MDGNDHAIERKGPRGPGFKGSSQRNAAHALSHPMAAIGIPLCTFTVSIIPEKMLS
jgi:hypothetical protein